MAKPNKPEKKCYIVDVTFLKNPEDGTAYILCKDCIPPLSDFAKIVKKRAIGTYKCDRCG